VHAVEETVMSLSHDAFTFCVYTRVLAAALSHTELLGELTRIVEQHRQLQVQLRDVDPDVVNRALRCLDDIRCAHSKQHKVAVLPRATTKPAFVVLNDAFWTFLRTFHGSWTANGAPTVKASSAAAVTATPVAVAAKPRTKKRKTTAAAAKDNTPTGGVIKTGASTHQSGGTAAAVAAAAAAVCAAPKAVAKTKRRRRTATSSMNIDGDGADGSDRVSGSGGIAATQQKSDIDAVVVDASYAWVADVRSGRNGTVNGAPLASIRAVTAVTSSLIQTKKNSESVVQQLVSHGHLRPPAHCSVAGSSADKRAPTGKGAPYSALRDVTRTVHGKQKAVKQPVFQSLVTDGVTAVWRANVDKRRFEKEPGGTKKNPAPDVVPRNLMYPTLAKYFSGPQRPGLLNVHPQLRRFLLSPYVKFKQSKLSQWALDKALPPTKALDELPPGLYHQGQDVVAVFIAETKKVMIMLDPGQVNMLAGVRQLPRGYAASPGVSERRQLCKVRRIAARRATNRRGEKHPDNSVGARVTERDVGRVRRQNRANASAVTARVNGRPVPPHGRIRELGKRGQARRRRHEFFRTARLEAVQVTGATYRHWSGADANKQKAVYHRRITDMDAVYGALADDANGVAATRCRDPDIARAYIASELRHAAALHKYAFHRARRVARFEAQRRRERADAVLLRMLLGPHKLEDVVFVIGDGYKGMGGRGHDAVPIIRSIKYLARHAPVLVTPEWGSTKYSLCCGYDTVHKTRDISVCTRKAGDHVRLDCRELLRPPSASAASAVSSASAVASPELRAAAPAVHSHRCTRRYRRDECAAEKLRAYLLLMESFVRDTLAALALQNSQMSAFAAARSAEKMTAVPAAVTRRVSGASATRKR
jgi:hypothetical protein